MDLVTMILACSLYSNNAVVNAIIDTGSNNNPLVISGKPFKTAQEALAYARQLQATSTPFTVGLMQIPDRWLVNQPVSLSELLRPCKNMVLATQVLNNAQSQCSDAPDPTACTLSIYHSGDPQSGLDYANQILQYANAHPFTPPPSSE